MVNKVAKVAVVGGKLEPKPNMGGYLVNALQRLGHTVACVLRSREVWDPQPGAWQRVRGLKKTLESEEEISDALDRYVNGVQVLFICTPAKPAAEMAYIQYAIKRGIYVVVLSKGALGDYYAVLKPCLPMIGRYGTVGGRTLILPWLKNQQLQGKNFILYTYLNASTNFFMDFTSRGSSPEDGFLAAKALSLAEPNSDDFVSFLNGEVGGAPGKPGDYLRKLCIAYNEAIADEDGPFITPASFDEYVPLEERDIRNLTLPTKNLRFLTCVFKGNGASPLEVERGAPGTLCAQFGEYTIMGGFCDVSRDVHLARWMQGGPTNGAQIVFQGRGNETGRIEIAGPGAGPDTVWSAIINLNEYLAQKNQPCASMEEVARPKRHKTSVAEAAAAKGLLGPFDPVDRPSSS